MSVFSRIILCYLFIISFSYAARILAVFPVPSISHQVVFRPLTQELAKRGHEIVIITPNPAFPKHKTPLNLTEIDVHDVSYKLWREIFMKESRGNKNDLQGQMETVLKLVVSLFDVQVREKQVRNLLQDKSQKFDLILSEACMRPALVFSYIYKAPVIQISSFGAMGDNYETIGAPVHPLLYFTTTRLKLNNLTLWEKITELYREYKFRRMYENNKILEHTMLTKHFGNNVPSIDELNNNVNMLFLNVNPIFDGIRPVPPTVIFMGGLHQKPDKELPLDLKSYLDSSKNGVIYMSFGTNVEPSTLPSEKIQNFIHAFSKLPYDVLWKWNKDELPGRTSNIRISKWLPQSDLLKHPKIKLFITQGGLQSTDEAITAGVPLIGIPMFGDQWSNVEKYEYHKIGIRLDLETVNEEKLLKTINTILEDNSYHRNIIRLRNYMRDEPMRPLDRAVWWTEYVLRHGGAKHLRSPAANMSWTEYLELKSICVVSLILLAMIELCIIVLKSIYHFMFRNYGVVKSKQA